MQTHCVHFFALLQIQPHHTSTTPPDLENCTVPIPKFLPSNMSLAECCVKGFEWTGTPVGTESKLANNNTYVTGTNQDVAILMISDLFGWTFVSERLLADHYAREANATVYLPDLYV